MMTNDQRIISNLERKYMESLTNLFLSDDFRDELHRLEYVVNNDYNFIRDNYEKKNKVDIAIERLIRYFIYKKSNINIVGIYPSPISCDMAIETEDCILNVDSKTIDSVGNASDINYFHFERNQSSFKHNPYGKQEGFDGVPVITNLPAIDSYTGKPVLTFFLKIIYSDNGREFSFYKKGNNISLTCLPNGILSNLFPDNMIFNFKTYTYTPYNYPICSKEYAESHGLKFASVDTFINELRIACFEVPFNEYTLGNINGRPVIINENSGFVPVRKKDGWYLQQIQAGHTARILYENLTCRIDGNGYSWYGHISGQI